MKISQSAIQLDYQYQKNTSQATLTDSSVRVITSDSAESTNTSSSSASLIQAQQQTLTDSVSSFSQSLVTNTASGDTHYFEQTDFLQSVSSVLAEEVMNVTSVQALDSNRINQAIAQVEVTSISQFESDTQIQTQAMGAITTEDGREISFLLDLNYDRNIKTTQESTFTGHRDLIDPLVINLNGGAPSLSSAYFEFDLDSDGTKETLNRTAHGSGFLALDKNSNGEIDDGQELFGPNSYSGFHALSQYDDDDNGWIDENDAIFNQLSYMDFNENGEQRIQSISDVGLGAIYLGSEKMDLDLFNSNGEFQANIARNGVALKENGQAVSLQEIHYFDQAIGKASMEKSSSIDLSRSLFGDTQILDTNNSTQSLSNTGTQVQIESALTQFQFNNDIINERVAETHVRIDQANRQNFITLDGIRIRFSNNISITEVGGSTAFNMGAGSAIQPSNNTIEHTLSHANSMSSHQTSSINNQSQQNVINYQRREDVQSIFQARIKAGFTIPNNDQSTGNLSKQDQYYVPTLSQSVFWQDERQQYQNKYEGGSKLDQLKQLVEDLKSIREQQMKNQDKIGLYIRVDKVK
jgi:hypothetical protein